LRIITNAERDCDELVCGPAAHGSAALRDFLIECARPVREELMDFVRKERGGFTDEELKGAAGWNVPSTDNAEWIRLTCQGAVDRLRALHNELAAPIPNDAPQNHAALVLLGAMLAVAYSLQFILDEISYGGTATTTPADTSTGGTTRAPSSRTRTEATSRTEPNIEDEAAVHPCEGAPADAATEGVAINAQPAATINAQPEGNTEATTGATDAEQLVQNPATSGDTHRSGGVDMVEVKRRLVEALHQQGVSDEELKSGKFHELVKEVEELKDQVARGPRGFKTEGGEESEPQLPDEFFIIAMNHIDRYKTIGDAVKELRKLVQEQKSLLSSCGSADT